MNIPKAVLSVFVCHFAAVAKCAWREVEILQAFTQGFVGCVLPNMRQVPFMDITDEILVRCAFAVIKKMFVCVQQRQAWTDFAVPADGHAASFDKGTLVCVPVEWAAGKLETIEALHNAGQCLHGLGLDVHERHVHFGSDFLPGNEIERTHIQVFVEQFSVVCQHIADGEFHCSKARAQSNDFVQVVNVTPHGDEGNTKFGLSAPVGAAKFLVF